MRALACVRVCERGRKRMCVRASAHQCLCSLCMQCLHCYGTVHKIAGGFSHTFWKNVKVIFHYQCQPGHKK